MTRWRRLGRELKKIGPAILGTSVSVDVAVATSDMVTADAHATYPIGLPSPYEAANVVHRRFYEGGYAVGCVHPSDDLSGIKLYVIPHWAVFDPAWLANLESFVKSGGTLVIGARTATRDMNNNVVGETIPGVLRGLAGVTVEEYGRQSDPARVRALSRGDETVATSMWYETLKCEKAKPLYVWKGRHLDGQPAVTVNEIGKGRVVYVGTYFEDSVADALAPVLAEMSGLSPVLPGLPTGVEAVLREGKGRKVWFLINRGDDPATLASTPKGADLVTGKPAGGALTLEQYGVAVIEE